MKRTSRPFCRDENGSQLGVGPVALGSNREVPYLVGLALHRKSGWSESHEIQYVGSLYTYNTERVSIKEVFSTKTTQSTLLAHKGKALQTHCKGKDFTYSFTQAFTDLCS